MDNRANARTLRRITAISSELAEIEEINKAMDKYRGANVNIYVEIRGGARLPIHASARGKKFVSEDKGDFFRLLNERKGQLKHELSRLARDVSS